MCTLLLSSSLLSDSLPQVRVWLNAAGDGDQWFGYSISYVGRWISILIGLSRVIDTIVEEHSLIHASLQH
jgi:hypothetical protein